MPASLNILRGFVGLLCVFFAHFFGRAIARRMRSQIGNRAMITWALRTLVTAMAVLWRAGFDAVSVLTLALAAFAGAVGFYNQWRPKRQDDLPHIV